MPPTENFLRLYDLISCILEALTDESISVERGLLREHYYILLNNVVFLILIYSLKSPDFQ